MLKKGLLSGLILILSCFPAFAADETVITTYYPSPYGYYKELKVNRSVTYAPVTSLPADGKEGELVFFNNDKKFYYYSGGWKALGGGQTPLSITGTPTWTEWSGGPFCFSIGGRKGSWTYNFPQPPVKIVAVEVKGQVLGYCLSATTVNWSIFVSSGNILTGHYSKDRITAGGEAVTNYSSGIGLSQSAVDLLQSVSSITVTWDINGGTPASACQCSQFGYGGVPETVTVYYNPA